MLRRVRSVVTENSDYLNNKNFFHNLCDLASQNNCSRSISSNSVPKVLSIPKGVLKYDPRSRSKSKCRCIRSRARFRSIYNSQSMSTSNFRPSDFSEASEAQVERFLVVGLGNYIYPGMRHSVGMMAVDGLMSRLGQQWEKNQNCGGFLGKSLITTQGDMVAAELFLFKPKILMNVNGKNVLKAAKHLDITADRIYLIHDELDKAVGKCGIKDGGSAKGHKGVLSCYDSLRPSTLWPKTSNGEFKGMTRLQIGIGRPTSQSQIVNYVLSHFHDEELEKINMAIGNGLDLLLKHITSRILLT